MVIPERLRDRMTAAGLSQSALARRIGVVQGTIAKLATGQSNGSKYLYAIARELGTTPAYLEGQVDDPSEGAAPVPTASTVAEQMDAVMVPLYDLSFSMGGGSFFDDAVSHEAIPFKKPWLRSHIQGRVDQAIMITGRGDSMKPTIDDGDVLLIDTAQIEVRDQDLIWAFAYGETGMVKRLRRQPKGGYLVQSDNDVVKPFPAADDEIHIVGRVVSILKWQ